MVITHYREVSIPEPLFQKGLPFLVTLIKTDVHVGSYIILWVWKTFFLLSQILSIMEFN